MFFVGNFEQCHGKETEREQIGEQQAVFRRSVMHHVLLILQNKMLRIVL